MPSKPKKKYTRAKMDGVHVAKIKNRYMFQKNTGYDRNGYHYYLIFTDKTSHRNVAVETTHLYEKDPARFRMLSRGDGIKMSLPGLDTPSLVLKKFYQENALSKPIDFAHRDVKVKKRVNSSIARRLFSFINSRAKSRSAKKQRRKIKKTTASTT